MVARFVAGSIRSLAELTGGMASVYDYADKSLSKIAQATASGYLLGVLPVEHGIRWKVPARHREGEEVGRHRALSGTDIWQTRRRHRSIAGSRSRTRASHRR
jgi:hypothetical protein